MSSPSFRKTWTISPNNQIVYTSVNQVAADILLAIGGTTGFLAITGVTCKGSCDGTIGAMDATNRWTNNTKTSTRFNGAGGAQSWIVFTLASGVDVLFTYDGVSDDVFKIAFSPGGLYTVAGTANQKPIATDEQDINPSGTSMVASATSADRRLHMWIDSTKKLIRFAIYRQNTLASVFGVELFESVVDGVVTVITQPTWGFLYIQNNLTPGNLLSGYVASTIGGLCKATVSSVVKSLQCGASVEKFCDQTTAFNAAKPQMQGGTGFAMLPLGLATTADSTAFGKLGNRFDWWQYMNTSALDGDTSDSKKFFLLGSTGCCAFPWDSATAPINA